MLRNSEVIFEQEYRWSEFVSQLEIFLGWVGGKD